MTTTNVTIESVFNECNSKIENKIGAAIRFVYLVGKNKLGTISACREILGYSHEDPKKNTIKSNTFSKKILLPLKIYLTTETKKVSEEDAKKIWSQGANDEVSKAIRKEILAMLPPNTREKKQMLNIGDLLK